MKTIKLLSVLFLGLTIFTTSCSSDESVDREEPQSNIPEATFAGLQKSAVASVNIVTAMSNANLSFDNCYNVIYEFSFENATDGLYNNSRGAIFGSYNNLTDFDTFMTERANSVNTQNGTSYVLADFVLEAINIREDLGNNMYNDYRLVNNNDIIDYFTDCAYNGTTPPTNSGTYPGACYNPVMVYPINAQVADVNTGIVTTVSVNDEMEFYDIIWGINNVVLMDLVFPIDLRDYNGQIHTANNYTELDTILASEICI